LIKFVNNLIGKLDDNEKDLKNNNAPFKEIKNIVNDIISKGIHKFKG
jgi:hypothetical protein